MGKFYTNVFNVGDYIHHYYIENGERKKEKVKFKPSLGLTSQKETGVTDIFGRNIGMFEFDSIKEMYSWKKEQEKYVDVYNDISPVNQFIVKNYRDKIEPDFSQMIVWNFDIEVFSSKGFPKPEEALYPITSIAVQDVYNDNFYVYGVGEYIPETDNVTYFNCKNEEKLLETFINDFRKVRPDVVTGWNIDNFDIPYLINRMKRILPEGEYRKLSTTLNIKSKTKKDNYGGVFEEFSIEGIQILDYMKLYEKFNMQMRESFSLDAISKVELGDEKIDYHSQYENLADLYEKNYQLYVTYNIKDVQLVTDLNKKLRFLELIFTMTYKAKTDVQQGFGTVGIWESMIYQYLYDRGMVLGPKKQHERGKFPGGYVQDVKADVYDWLTVWDITSSYPSTIISFNISPETIVDVKNLPNELREVIENKKWTDDYIDLEVLEEAKPLLKKYNISLSANNEFFSKEKYGIFPTLVKEIFEERVKAKFEAKKIYREIEEKKSNGEDVLYLENKWSALDALQYALKILLNSFYGSFSNPYFRYFDIRLASAVTTNAQVAVRGPVKYLTEKIKKIRNIYIDTDSIFLDCSQLIIDRFKTENISIEEKRNFIKKLNKNVFGPKIKEYYQQFTDNMNTYYNAYEMDCEVIADRSIFLSKKKYIMNLIYKDGIDLSHRDLKIRGVEIVRSSTPEVCRNKLKEMINVILDSNDNDTVIDFIEAFKKEFFKLPFEEIAFPRGVNGLGKYKNADKSVPIHVKSTYAYNKALKDKKLTKYQSIQEGEKIKFAYILEPNNFNSRTFACINKLPEELRSDVIIDYDTQFEKAFLSPAKIIFDALLWNVERVASLESWF